VINAYGKGAAIYCSSLIGMIESLGDRFIRLLKRWQDAFGFEAEARPAVDLTRRRELQLHRYRLSVVDFQNGLPNTPQDKIPV
jgi:hypothetical protein